MTPEGPTGVGSVRQELLRPAPSPEPEPFAWPSGLPQRIGEPAGRPEWLAITNLVSSAMPEDASEDFLGELVLVAQQASDRAVTAARDRAGRVVSEASEQADHIRAEGRRRVQAMSRLRTITGRRPAPAEESDLHAPTARPLSDVVTARNTAPPQHDGISAPVPPTPLVAAPDGGPFAPAAPTGYVVAHRSPERPEADGHLLAPGLSPSGPEAAAVPLNPVSIEVIPFDSVYGPISGAPAPVGPAPAPVGPASGAPALVVEAPASVGPAHASTAPRVPAPTEPVAPVSGSPIEPAGPEIKGFRGVAWLWSSLPKAALPAVTLAALAVAVVVAFLTGFSLYEHYVTAAHERNAQHRLSAQFARDQANDVGAAGVALLTVPRLGMKGQAVVEGATLGHLRQGPAHVSGSQAPGRPGTVIVVGHRHAYGGPFNRLGQLHVGDTIAIRTVSGSYHYRVSRDPQVLSTGRGATFRLPTVAQVRDSGGDVAGVDQALILATGVGSAGNRLQVVVANLDQPIVAADNGATASGPGIGAVFRSVPGDRSGYVFALCWFLVILGTLYGAKRYWSRVPPSVVVAVVTVLALFATYQIYGSIDRVLPGTS